MICKICGADMRLQFHTIVLRKYDVGYFQCNSCGFLQTEEPHWLQEAYSTAIVTADTGILQRNLHMSRVISVLFWHLFGRTGRFLDAAGGYGIFVRLMRDFGFDYYWSDPHAPNLVARGFEDSSEHRPYAAVSAFEVLEHVPDPLEFLSELLRATGARTIVASTALFSGDAPLPEQWWYYTPQTGQHISFYQLSTLQAMARKLKLKLYSHNDIHIWTERRLSPWAFQLMTHPRLAATLSVALRPIYHTRIWSDRDKVLADSEHATGGDIYARGDQAGGGGKGRFTKSP